MGNKVKKLEVNGRTLYFEKKYHEGEISDYYTTLFYTELKTKLVKKYIFFGPLIEVPDYEVAFELDVDIDSIRITKQELRKMIEKEMALLERADEIKRGEYI